MKRLMVVWLLVVSVPVPAWAQWYNGVVLDVQEIDIAAMKRIGSMGGDAVLRVMEQFVDRSYQYAYISNSYMTPQQEGFNLEVGKQRMLVTVIGYPQSNHLIYAQVLYDTYFFLVILCKKSGDMKKTTDIAMSGMAYDKYSSAKRNAVRDVIQRNNIDWLGIGR